MEIILAIMLYLQLIFSPGTYYKTQIDTIQNDNWNSISAVMGDQAQMEVVNSSYLPRVSQIVVIDNAETN
jgi:hypothetical protein